MRPKTLALLASFVGVLAVTSAPFADPLSAHQAPRWGGAGAAAAPAPAGGAPALAGTVLETMDSGGYTYMKLATAQGEVWAAVSPAKVKVGDAVTVLDPIDMHDFEARSLGRKFDRIVFGTLGGAPPSADGAGPASPHGHTQAASAELAHPVAKAKGADARTVAEVWAERTTLAGKPVAVRGQVVKYNGGIMGRNWLHLQDGSGSEGASDFDLAVTTHDTAKVGDIVVARGVVHVDEDFGAGYAYPVIVEDATVEK